MASTATLWYPALSPVSVLGVVVRSVPLLSAPALALTLVLRGSYPVAAPKTELTSPSEGGAEGGALPPFKKMRTGWPHGHSLGQTLHTRVQLQPRWWGHQLQPH